MNALRRRRGSPYNRGHGEIDRIYGGTTADCGIEDRVQQRADGVSKSGNSSTVVWNPWCDKVFADMAAGVYQ